MIYSPCGPQRIGEYAAMNDLDPRSSGNEIEVEPARSDGVRDRLPAASGREDAPGEQRTIGEAIRAHAKARPGQPAVVARSEERRVGKECRSRRSPDHEQSKHT